MTPEKAKRSAEYFYAVAAREEPQESVRCSYLAGLKAAGAVVACHPECWRARPVTRDVWTLMERIADRWAEDIAFFRRLAALRSDIEMGLPVMVSAEYAAEVHQRVGRFLDEMELASCVEDAA